MKFNNFNQQKDKIYREKQSATMPYAVNIYNEREMVIEFFYAVLQQATVANSNEQFLVHVEQMIALLNQLSDIQTYLHEFNQ